MVDPEDRFWSKVGVAGPDECWEWEAGIGRDGYGKFFYNGKHWQAHRVAWLFGRGEIPPGAGHHGTCVCHVCDNKRCVNPQHLFLGTVVDNNLDKTRKGRSARQPGEKHGMAKLSNLDVLHIRDLISAGCQQTQIADVFGVSKTTICEINTGRKWSSV